MPDVRLPTPQAAVLQASDMVVVRLRQDLPTSRERQDIACQDSFSAIVQLRDFARHELWRGGRLVFGGGHARMALAVTHLGEGWACRHLSAFDNVRFHIPRAALDAVTEELELPAISGFACARGTVDPVAYHLASALLPALEAPALDGQGQGNRLFVDQVALSLMLHMAQTYGGMVSLAPPGGRRMGGLSQWQEARAKDFLVANLTGDVAMAEVAAQCGLSRSHFIKAFRETTGQTPYRWLMDRRVDRARDLLRGPLPIAEVALACGFADQSHLTRVFAAATGLPPAAWRRRQM
ncbi:helix-turn-helix domain-containing protein [Nitrospirillum iridis]|uniref:AraC family transcriptional regulator n=1 Tax=Nitrospirillum iridis TaxID=765888 RepID=A0A7X0B0R1_9PROT|nr:AraC family transcriptional regulator [Nitrospirillum iridis]MBB6253653.1 AraC family transcriptional regulator [Nitrospirillum iridis]